MPLLAEAEPKGGRSGFLALRHARASPKDTALARASNGASAGSNALENSRRALGDNGLELGAAVAHEACHHVLAQHVHQPRHRPGPEISCGHQEKQCGCV